MLARALKSHQANQSDQKEQQEQLKKEAVSSVKQFSGVLVGALNSDVEKAYYNQKALENEAKLLQKQVHRFSKQTQQWCQMIENFNVALKELGDVENWARTIETDITTIASALEYAYKGDGPTPLKTTVS